MKGQVIGREGKQIQNIWLSFSMHFLTCLVTCSNMCLLSRSNPCLAVIPWKSPDEALNFPTESTSANQDKIESDFSCSQSSSSSSSSNSSRMSLVIESIPETEQFQDKGVHHVEIVGDCSTFSLEDDDMEP